MFLHQILINYESDLKLLIKCIFCKYIYIGFATLILQYRVTLFAIPLVPVMEKLVVEPGKKFFGEKFGEKKSEVM